MTHTQFSRRNNPPGFYTYAYLRAADSDNGPKGSPYYIGKGVDKRAWLRHGRKGKFWKAPANEYILILKWGLEEEQALNHEIYLIALFGNYHVGGLLTKNFTDGGEGVSGYVYSEKDLHSMSAGSMKRSADPDYLAFMGKTVSAAKLEISFEESEFTGSFDEWSKASEEFRGRWFVTKRAAEKCGVTHSVYLSWSEAERRSNARKGQVMADSQKIQLSEIRLRNSFADSGFAGSYDEWIELDHQSRYKFKRDVKNAEKYNMPLQEFQSLTDNERNLLARGLYGQWIEYGYTKAEWDGLSMTEKRKAHRNVSAAKEFDMTVKHYSDLTHSQKVKLRWGTITVKELLIGIAA